MVISSSSSSVARCVVCVCGVWHVLNPDTLVPGNQVFNIIFLVYRRNSPPLFVRAHTHTQRNAPNPNFKKCRNPRLNETQSASCLLFFSPYFYCIENHHHQKWKGAKKRGGSRGKNKNRKAAKETYVYNTRLIGGRCVCRHPTQGIMNMIDTICCFQTRGKNSIVQLARICRWEGGEKWINVIEVEAEIQKLV